MLDVKMGLVTAVVVACGLAMNLAHGASPLAGEMKSLAGEPVDLAAYKGKVVLVVNVASRCGYTRQYAGLQKLYDAHKDKGFVILGFPANDFGAQEPGSDAEIAEFCSTKYGVTFPMFAKITVKGDGKPPLYAALTDAVEPKGEVAWNFEKFLIGRDGTVVGRYKSGVAPDSTALVKAIEAELAKE
ncbi:MAG: glutathione peroxidase [Planctomycetaceae bacterium]